MIGSAPAPTLTVVLPCHNVESTLPAQLDALVPQVDVASGEIVIVDNRSTDTTRVIADRAAVASGGIIRVITADQGRGVAYARNAGVVAAASDRFLFCDGDDIIGPGWVDAMLNGLQGNDVVTGTLEVEALNSDRQAASRGPSRRPTFYGIFPVASGGNMALRRSAWEQVGPLDEEIASLEDMDWSLRAWLAGLEIAHEPGAVIHYRYRSGVGPLWRQGYAYGRSRAPIARRLYDATGDRPPRFVGVRSWVWLAAHLPDVFRASRRDGLAWVAGNRIGQLRGCVAARFVVL